MASEPRNYPDYVFVAYDEDFSAQTYDIAVSLEPGNLVGRPVKYIRHDLNTRPAPAATDTGLVTVGGEYLDGHTWKPMPAGVTDFALRGFKTRALCARSQAEELLAAERAEKERLAALLHDNGTPRFNAVCERAEKAEADNAAQAARIKELELQLSASKETAKIKRVEYLDLDQDHSELKADYAVSEAQLKAVRKALEATHEAISEYYRYQTGGEMRGSYDGKPERNALWKSMYQARAVLGGKPS